MSNTTLITVNYVLHVSVLPLIIVFGVIGNISSIYIFSRPSLYRSCSIYFFAGAINGLVLLLFGTTTRWLGHAFQELDATQYSLFFCRFRYYLINIIYDLAPYFIACVTIDRYCSSSTNAQIRRLSTRPRLAYAVIVVTVLIAFLAFSHVLINYTIINSVCQPRPGLYTQFFASFSTVFCFVPIILIIIFGIGTTQNVRAQRKRIQPMVNQAKRINRRHLRSDAQILLILFVHVACFACFAMPYHILLIVAAIEPTVLMNPTFRFMQDVTIIALNFSQAITCYVYTLTADLYRKELMIIIRRVLRRPRMIANNNAAETGQR